MHVKLYTKEHCPYCVNAKNVLDWKRIPYELYQLNVDFTRETIKEQYPNARTFPIVVIDGFHIGGFNELNKMIQEQTNISQRLLNEGD